MMGGPLVTIGIATYNRADGYLREALASALAQTYAPLEIVVCDNASTDDTERVVAAVADERVRYVRHETNIGANANFASCLDAAQGTYFLLLHDDDSIDPDMISSCMDALSVRRGSEPPGLIRTGNRVIDDGGAVISERVNQGSSGSVEDLVDDWFERRTSLYLCNTLYRTDALREVGGFRSKRDLYNDVAASLRVAARYGVLDVPEVRASFRRHGANHGGAQSIEAWCEDSMYLIDVMCEVAPERASDLRSRGLVFFSGNNYSRVARLGSLAARIEAYWLVYRYFGFRTSPLRSIARRNLRVFRRSVYGSTV